jgi:addiction module HigA family antidote
MEKEHEKHDFYNQS